MALALAFGGFLFFKGSSPASGGLNPTGPQHRQVEAFIQGITFGTNNQSQFDNTGKLTVGPDAVVGGGTLTVTTSNTATSTAIVGCIQTYATSTATPVFLQATTTKAGGVAAYFLFGTCPNL